MTGEGENPLLKHPDDDNEKNDDHKINITDLTPEELANLGATLLAKLTSKTTDDSSRQQ